MRRNRIERDGSLVEVIIFYLNEKLNSKEPMPILYLTPSSFSPSSESPFTFSRIRNMSKKYLLAKKIDYRETRPTVVIAKTDFDSDGAYFTKSAHWKYEEEYRIIKKPEGVEPVGLDRNQFPIYLFDLPADVIKEVILGCRCDLELGLEIEGLKNEKFFHAVIKKASLSDNKFEIVIT